MEFSSEQERFNFGNLSRDIDLHDLDKLNERKWDLLDELAAVEIAKTSILKQIRGQQ